MFGRIVISCGFYATFSKRSGRIVVLVFKNTGTSLPLCM